MAESRGGGGGDWDGEGRRIRLVSNLKMVEISTAFTPQEEEDVVVLLSSPCRSRSIRVMGGGALVYPELHPIAAASMGPASQPHL